MSIPFDWVCSQFDETIDWKMNLAAPHSFAVLPLSSTKGLLFVTVYHCFSTPITGPKLKLHSNERCFTMSSFLLRFSSPFCVLSPKIEVPLSPTFAESWGLSSHSQQREQSVCRARTPSTRQLTADRLSACDCSSRQDAMSMPCWALTSLVD